MANWYAIGGACVLMILVVVAAYIAETKGHPIPPRQQRRRQKK